MPLLTAFYKRMQVLKAREAVDTITNGRMSAGLFDKNTARNYMKDLTKTAEMKEQKRKPKSVKASVGDLGIMGIAVKVD